MKSWAWGILILIIIFAIGGFVYLVRPVALPTEDVVSEVDQLTSEENFTLYRISQADSHVEFNINEVLRGEPFTVVGATDQVAGDIRLNLANPSLSEVGVVRINARTLETDNQSRNGALARFILKSEDDTNEFITFIPTSISGLPSEIVEGEGFNFQVTGGLWVSGTTRSVTFSAYATLTESGLVGSAESTVNYKDFNLTIPEVEFVASVEDEVLLKIDFLAKAVD